MLHNDYVRHVLINFQSLQCNLRDALTSQEGFACQSMKIQYTGMPDRIMIMPTPTSHGET